MHVVRTRQLFDGQRFIGPADVVIEGSTIARFGPPEDHGADVAVDDLGDVTVLPGLVDAHQHLTWDCSTDPVAWHVDHDDDALLDRARANARRALAAGITTIRDLGGRNLVPLVLRDELAHDPVVGPTLLVSGPPLTTPGGHCHFLGGECADVAELEATVARQAEAGVDAIKIMATGGNVTPGSLPHESQFGLAELQAVVRAAHEYGLPVAAHAHGTSGVADAVDAGVDSIEHCSFMTVDGIAQDPDLVARIADSGIVVSITSGSLPGELPPPIALRLPALAAHFRSMLDAGARCILSTDAGIGPLKPHDVLPRAVLQAVDVVNLPTERALAMCTSLPADALGIGDRAGSVRPGAPADLLVVDGLLDRDPEAILRPVRVVRSGVNVTAHG